MRNKIVSGFVTATIIVGFLAPAYAGGVGEPEIEPEVFTASEAVAAGSLGGTPGLILLGVLVGGLVIAGDSN
jgi:hypothetical protein